VIVGKINYPDAPAGQLIFAQAALTTELPYQVLEYSQDDPGFPRDSTADQWFNSQQFDAYQQIGRYLGQQAMRAAKETTAAAKEASVAAAAAAKPARASAPISALNSTGEPASRISSPRSAPSSPVSAPPSHSVQTATPEIVTALGLRVLTAAEVAAVLRVEADVIVTAISNGELPGNRIGGYWRVDQAALMRWLQGKYETTGGLSGSSLSTEARTDPG
jgi:excisionase family DNA binding protein